MKIIDVNLDDFDYNLPKDRIALFPLDERDKSKLLVAYCSKREIQHSYFYNIENYIPENSIIIVNSTKVIQARINLHKPTGGKVELLCITPLVPSSDPQVTMQSKGSCRWKCIVGGRKVLANTILSLSDYNFTAKILSRFENYADVEFNYPGNLSFAEILAEIGKIPLPPYINRESTELDNQRYQTIYSRVQGSVAAPTAGLHFTETVINNLKAKNIKFDEVILHVGPGTFVPIEKSVHEHNMHEEQFYVSTNTLESIIISSKKGAKIIATGTTTLRTLESLYWIGAKIYFEKYDFEQTVFLNQFEPYQIYEKYGKINLEQSFNSILDKLTQKKLSFISGYTKLFIVPGYEIQTASALITNFHLPKSTLLLLVYAFVGSDFWKDIYNEALNNDYRFLSYGDSSLLIR